jgi:hypothetical protein
MVPHGLPAATYTMGWQVLAFEAAALVTQVSPSCSSQAAAVSLLGSHAAPTVLPVVWHVPLDAPDGVTHPRPAPQGCVLEQVPPTVVVERTQVFL